MDCSLPGSSAYGIFQARLLRPWDFPGKSTGVGCHCLLLSKISMNQKSTDTGTQILDISGGEEHKLKIKTSQTGTFKNEKDVLQRIVHYLKAVTNNGSFLTDCCCWSPLFFETPGQLSLAGCKVTPGEHPPGPVHGGSLVTSCSQPLCPFLGMNQPLVQSVPLRQGTFQTCEKSKQCSPPTSPIKFSFGSKRITK